MQVKRSLKDYPQLWITPTHQLVVVHAPEACEPPCPVHAPTEHHMRQWPMVWCDSRLVRVCQHGVGHPDPDDHAGGPLGHVCCHWSCCDPVEPS